MVYTIEKILGKREHCTYSSVFFLSSLTFDVILLKKRASILLVHTRVH